MLKAAGPFFKTTEPHIRKGSKSLNYHDDGGDRPLRNIGTLLPEYSHMTQTSILRTPNIPWTCILLPMQIHTRGNLTRMNNRTHQQVHKVALQNARKF